MEKFTNNKEKNRFELEVEGRLAVIEYMLNTQNIMFLNHTEVPRELEGKGVGSRLVKQSLEYIRDHDYKLAPICPFVSAYLRRHPEWQDLLSDGYRV